MDKLNLSEIKAGSLLLRDDGKTFLVFQRNDDIATCLSTLKDGYYYVSKIIVTEKAQEQKYKKVERVYNGLPMEVIVRIINMYQIEINKLEEIINLESTTEETYFSKLLTEHEGIKNELQPGRVFFDRYRSLHLIYSTDANTMRTIVLLKGSSSYYEGLAQFSYNDFRKNLKAEFARKGIQIILDAKNINGLAYLLKAPYGKVSNDMLNEVRNFVIADLRTIKDLGGRKMPKYKNPVWFIHDCKLQYSEPNKEVQKEKDREPSYSEVLKAIRLARKFPKLIKSLSLTDIQLSVFLKAMDYKRFHSVLISQNTEFSKEVVDKALSELLELKYIERVRGKENTFCIPS